MEKHSIIKGFYKIEPYLDAEQKQDLENYAVQFAKFWRVYFKIITISPEDKLLFIQTKQEKKPTDTPYFTKKELVDKTREHLQPFFVGYTLRISATEYTQSKSDIITPDYLKKELQKQKIRIKDIANNTGIEMSNLSAWVNGIRPMSNIVKNMFYYYFKYIESQNK